MCVGPAFELPSFPPSRLEDYLDGTAGAPPRAQLMRALELVPLRAGAQALDLGCGPGRESIELLRRGFRVTAVDPYRSMLDATRALAARECPAQLDDLRCIHSTLEALGDELLQDRFDLVHAGFVLPFVQARDFDRAFDALRGAIRPGGMFAGQFFGANDEFVRDASPGSMTHHSAGELPALFRGFSLLEHEEVERDGHIGRGKSKHWHVHHVIAQRDR